MRLASHLHTSTPSDTGPCMNTYEIVHETAVVVPGERCTLPGFFVLTPSPTEQNEWALVTNHDQIKFKKLESTTYSYCIYRVQDRTQLANIPAMPGTIIVIEGSLRIKYVDDESYLCKWNGNAGRKRRWAGRILHWDGVGLKWATASTVSTRSRQTGLERINGLGAADIVRSIISGTGSTKRPSKRLQATGVSETEDPPTTGVSGTEDLHSSIDSLQATIKEKDIALTRIKETLDKTIKENAALRAQLLDVTEKPSQALDLFHRSPSSLASTVSDGPVGCLGDILYSPPCGVSPKSPSSETFTSNYFQDLQLCSNPQGGGDHWDVGWFSEYPTFLSTSSSVSPRPLALISN